LPFAARFSLFLKKDQACNLCFYTFVTMLKKIVIALLMLGAALKAEAQTPYIDSLQAELVTMPENADTAIMRERAWVLTQISNAYWGELQDHNASRVYARRALMIYHQLGRTRGMANAFQTIAFCHMAQSRIPESIDTFLLSYRGWEQLRDTAKMTLVTSLIADNYLNLLGNEDKAKQYARLCFDLSARAKRTHGLCACGVLLGSIFGKMGQLDSARLQLHQTLALVEASGSSVLLPSVYLAMAQIEEKQKKYTAERDWLLKTEAAFRDFPDSRNFNSDANYLLALFRCYLNLGDLPRAVRYQKLAGASMADVEDLTYYDRYYHDMSRLAELQNRPADALRYFKRYIEARDSINNLEKTRRVTQIQMSYDFERKQAAQTAAQERELTLRDARNQQQRLLSIFVTLAVIVGAAFWLYAYRQKQEHRRSELELANLRAQINPHFIFNCLNSIYRYTKERDIDTAAKYLQKFSSLLRLVLENSRTEKITLARDLDALQLYADIEGLRFKEKLHFSVDMDPQIDPTFLEIPGMIIQPHVENAIWHGLLHRPTGGKIVVRLRQPTETLLRIEIEDNGIGRAAAAELASKSATQQKSLGQKITAERLKATGKLAHTETIDLFDDEGNAAGTRIVLDVPL
jgi:signal transduction histidine kinase